MKKNDVQVGQTYLAKVSGKLARVRIERASPHGGWEAVNVDTGRRVRIKSAQRLRRPVRELPANIRAGLAALSEAYEEETGGSRRARAKAIAAADQENARMRDERGAAPDGMTASERAMAQTATAPTATAAGTVEAAGQAGDGGAAPDDPPPDEAAGYAGDPEVCATVGCGRPAALTYLGRPRCQECYEDDVADGDETSNETPNDEETEMAKAKKTTGKTASKSTKAPKKAAKPPKAAKPKATKPAGAAKPKRRSALDAAAEVLKKAGQPMRSQELITAMAEQGLWASPAGKTPHATLYAAILREIGAKGGAARFRKVERGQFEYAGGAA